MVSANLISILSTDIEGRYQTPYTVQCNGVVSHGAQIGGLGVFADHTHTQKQTQNKCAHDLTHLMNHDYFYYGKNPKTPNLSPLLGSRCAGSGISLLYICDPVSINDEIVIVIKNGNVTMCLIIFSYLWTFCEMNIDREQLISQSCMFFIGLATHWS